MLTLLRYINVAVSIDFMSIHELLEHFERNYIILFFIIQRN